MSIKLGEMLVEAGLLTQEQLEATLKNQGIYGGRLGTNLIELGYLAEEDLARFLSKKLELPCATKEQLMSITPDIIQLIPKEVADKYKVVPLGRDRKRLTLAMLDPADLSVVDAISFITGYYISPLIAPELLLIMSLEKYYGIKRDVRYIQITEKKKAPPALASEREMDFAPVPASVEIPEKQHDDFDFSLPLHDEEVFDIDEAIEAAVEPVVSDPVEEKPAATEPVAMEPAVPEEAAAEPITLEPAVSQEAAAEPVVSEPFDLEPFGTGPVEAGLAKAELAGIAPIEAEPFKPEPINVETGIVESLEERPLEAEPATPEPAAAAPVEPTEETVSELLAGAADREEIAEILTAYLGPEFDRVAIFMMKGTIAEGWKGLHNNSPIPGIGNLQVSLDEPSVLKIVNDGRSFYLGPIPDTPDNARMIEGLGGGSPSSALLLPVIMMGRVVAVIYVDGGTRPVGDRLADLQKLIGKATIAFEILILKNKILMT